MRRKHHSKRRRTHRQRTLRRNQKGGGYSEKLDFTIYPGQQVHQQYTGVGMDCAGSPTRPGALDGIGRLNGGLPGVSYGGGKKRRGGGSQRGSGGIVVQNNGTPVIQNGGTVLGVAVNQGEEPGSVRFHNIPGALPKDPAGYTYQYMQDAAKPQQSGGRYGFDPVNAASTYGANGVGYAGLAPIGRVACESGSYDALNADKALQLQTTNRMTYQPPVPGFSSFVPRFLMSGGSRKGPIPPHMRRRKSQKRQQKKKLNQQGGGTNAENLANNPPQVFAGQIDSMKYNAQTAGYSWRPLDPAVQNNPGVSDQGTYAARHFNGACLKTN